ncbi:MAG: WD40 repeat domain-containing protein [Pirellulales bacterium]|nr:WD40 repeat domain-containing protein [Pirellulales bacterium]
MIAPQKNRTTQQILGLVWAALAVGSPLSAQELKLQNTIIAHDKPVFCVAFSPDGCVLASASLREAKLWDVATGKNITTLDDAGLVRFVAFSPDGSMLALSTMQGGQGTIKLWDVATRKNTATLETYDGNSFMVFGLDGKTLLWTDDRILAPDGKTRTQAHHTTIKRWDIGTGNNTSICSVCKNVPGAEEEMSVRMVVALVFSPNGKTLAARDNEGAIEIWDMATCKKSSTFSANVNYSAFSVAFSPDGKTLAVARGLKNLTSKAGEETIIDLRDVATGKNTTTFRGHSAEVFSVVFSPDGNTLASCGYEKTIKLWDAATGKSIANLDTGSKAVNQVVFSPDGKTLASAGHDGTIKLWDVVEKRRGGGGL